MTRGADVPRDAEISVIVMSINGDDRVATAVLSLLTEPLLTEVIVVNTGGNSVQDRLRDLMNRIVLIEAVSARLPGGTRNLGIAESTAGIVAFLAADCRATPGWVASRIEAHQSGSAAVASALRPDAGLSGQVSDVSWAAYALLHARRAPECPASEAALYGVSYDRKLFVRHGLFRDDIRIGEDTDFNARVTADETLTWAPHIVTLHTYPTKLWSALSEMADRGRQLYEWNAARVDWPLWPSLRRTIGSWIVAQRLQSRTEGQVRRSLRRAGPLVTLLAFAYACGSGWAAVHSLWRSH